MKTIKMSLENVRGKMSRNEMKMIKGGGCFFRPDQDSTSGSAVSDCKRVTVEVMAPDGDLSNSVCVCS